jgi:hypothetical protein
MSTSTSVTRPTLRRCMVKKNLHLSHSTNSRFFFTIQRLRVGRVTEVEVHLYRTTPESWSSDWGRGSSLPYNAWELVEWLRWRFFFTIQRLRVGRVTEVEVLLYHTTPESVTPPTLRRCMVKKNLHLSHSTNSQALYGKEEPPPQSLDQLSGVVW